jgi:hypothetical protein
VALNLSGTGGLYYLFGRSNERHIAQSMQDKICSFTGECSSNAQADSLQRTSDKCTLTM